MNKLGSVVHHYTPEWVVNDCVAVLAKFTANNCFQWFVSVVFSDLLDLLLPNVSVVMHFMSQECPAERSLC